mgnify:FL=1
MEAKHTAAKILTDHRDELDKLANALLEKETMDAAEIRAMLGLPPAHRDEPAVQEVKPEEPAAEAPKAE